MEAKDLEGIGCIMATYINNNHDEAFWRGTTHFFHHPVLYIMRKESQTNDEYLCVINKKISSIRVPLTIMGDIQISAHKSYKEAQKEYEKLTAN